MYHAAVLLADGTVSTFGGNTVGQLGVNDTTQRNTPVQVFGISSSATAVACGQEHTAVLLADGTVRTFGYNVYGQLGVNDTTSRQTPVQVFGISSSAVAVSGGLHTVVLLSDGTVRTFGRNNNGQLGINVNGGTRQTPVTVLNITSATAVAGGFSHTAVLLADGTVRTFGDNDSGHLGIDVAGGTRQTPVQVLNITSATAVSGGIAHTAVLLADGTVRTFGQNSNGQLGINVTSGTRQTPVQVFGISSSAVAVACGAYHTIVLLADGTVRTFGRNTNGQLGVNDNTTRQTPVQVFGISSSATAIAGGSRSYHTAVLLADGSVRTFGRNANGQLGVGDTASRLTPVQVVTGFSSVLGRVAAGGQHTAVVMGDGTLRVFGQNNRGQLGLGDTTNRLTPVQVSGLTSATTVACGLYQTVVLLADGTVRTFGLNNYGQLGVNDTTSRLTPVTVLNITGATAVACGWFYTAVLLADGTVRTFGRNNNGQLGVNDTTQRLTPVTVLNITTATAVACGGYQTAVLLANGTVRTFGRNVEGQLGVNDTTQRNTPVQVFGISSSAMAVACGLYFTVVLLADGTVRTFGSNTFGELGINVAGGTRQTPVTVLNITSATAVGCGRYHTFAILADGTVRTFGANGFGRLGVGDTTDRPTPVQVFGISSSATAIAGGGEYTAILLADGTLRTFGYNNSGQLGVADTVNRLIPVKVGVSGNKVAGGRFHTAVVSNDGTVRTFGYNDFGQLGVNDTTQRNTPVQVTVFTSATAVACGWYNTAVLLADGTVRTIGDNRWGQLGVNDNTQRNTPVTLLNITSATAVACGKRHTAVILADGTVRTFGLNDTGQLGINVSGGTRQTPVQVVGISSSAVAVACGGYHTTVLLADGTVRTFGSNGNGALGINVSGGSRETPVQVFGISSSATAVSCGRYRTAVLLADGTVRIFGDNNSGELGINVSGGSRQTPVQVFGISSSAVAVATGRYQTTVLLADGTVRTFGRNEYGELGINLAGGSRQTPVQVFGISSSASAVTLGNYHTAVLLSDGTVRTFGNNGQGQLGVNDTTSRLTPVQVITAPAIPAASTTAGSIAGGWYHTAVILTDGTVRTFGFNNFGQLGLGDTAERNTPVQVFGISSSAVAVAGGCLHTAVLLSNGTVRTFGRNGNGQLGVNDNTIRYQPVQVWGISSSATAVACGQYYTAVLLANGTVMTFGRNSGGQLGVNDTTDRLTPVQVFGISSSATAVACGQYHTAVLLANGTVRTFGNNNNGGLGDNTTTQRNAPVQVWGISSSAIAIACGGFQTVVLLADGTVMKFGYDGVAASLTPVMVLNISTATAVACGYGHTVVLLADGTVRTFGRNDYGKLGVNDTTNRGNPVQVWEISSSATAVAGGRYHTAVLLANGTVRTFGGNGGGQLGVNESGGTSSRLTPVTVLNIPSPITFITNATAIVVPLSSASTPVASFLLSTAAIITYPFIQFPALNLGPVTYPQYQLELTTDYARKLTTSTWTIGSDERLKTDIETANVDRCVEIVQNLDLKRFAWNFPDGSQPPDSHSLGWIAQEFAQFFPRSVEEAPAHGIMDFKNLNSDQIIKVMWGALKKLRADLKSQKSSDSELSTAGDNASPTPE
jgi:alpha-tubulin suppressor-like RCC1 family protein